MPLLSQMYKNFKCEERRMKKWNQVKKQLNTYVNQKWNAVMKQLGWRCKRVCSPGRSKAIEGEFGFCGCQGTCTCYGPRFTACIELLKIFTSRVTKNMRGPEEKWTQHKLGVKTLIKLQDLEKWTLKNQIRKEMQLIAHIHTFDNSTSFFPRWPRI